MEGLLGGKRGCYRAFLGDIPPLTAQTVRVAFSAGICDVPFSVEMIYRPRIWKGTAYDKNH